MIFGMRRCKITLLKRDDEIEVLPREGEESPEERASIEVDKETHWNHSALLSVAPDIKPDVNKHLYTKLREGRHRWR